jgi:tetratricopeptide (TPR) repeat protein
MADKSAQTFMDEGKQAFEQGDFVAAVQAFQSAAEAFSKAGDETNAAEAKNNLSVALLQDGKAQESLDAVLGTHLVFAKAGDIRRQAMALGNVGSALEALNRRDEAIQAFEESAGLFEKFGDGDLQALVLRSAAGIKLKNGKIGEAAMTMMASLGAVKNPTLMQRFLKFLLRIVPWGR